MNHNTLFWITHGQGPYMDLRKANLRKANLRKANLRRADLSEADLSEADLRWADLSEADLSEADLRWADLSGADLSGAIGFLNESDWIDKNFTSDDLGIIVFKAFGNTPFSSPVSWIIKRGEFITEVVNSARTFDCACGVNFATEKWVKGAHSNSEIWKCRIRYKDLVSVVVPYHTDGKARCGRLELLEKIS